MNIESYETTILKLETIGVIQQVNTIVSRVCWNCILPDKRTIETKVYFRVLNDGEWRHGLSGELVHSRELYSLVSAVGAYEAKGVYNEAIISDPSKWS